MTKGMPLDTAASDLVSLRAAIEAAGDVVYDWDLSDDTIRWRGQTDALFPNAEGVPCDGTALRGVVHPEDVSLRQRSLNNHIAQGDPYDCEYRVRAGDGTYHWVHDRGAVLAAGDRAGGRRMLGLLRFITARKRNEARLEFLANHDALTGQFNKARLAQSVDQALAESLRFGTAGGFAMFGVDQLAMINGAYSPDAGDAVLIEVSKRLAGCLRESDVIGRVSGDRFGVLLTRCVHEEAWRAAERAIEAVRAQPVETPAGPVRITLTGGVVVFPAQASTSRDIMAKAEGVLRQAKQSGRNQTGLYEMTEDQRQSYRTTLDIGAEVETALRERRLKFAYQPIVHAGDFTPAFHESLLRMVRRDGQIVNAGQFVPVVEQLGLMRALDRRVLEDAVAELHAAPTAAMAINISGLTTSDRAWFELLSEKLRGHPDVAGRLVVEITETAALRDIEETARFVAAVRALGCRVAVDDFGAGFTNFRHLKTLTVDVVKIDGSFVRGIDQEPQNRLFVRNLISLAGSLGLTTVAECVETEAEARVLAEEGADLLQGYYIARPDMTAPWPREGAVSHPTGGGATPRVSRS